MLDPVWKHPARGFRIGRRVVVLGALLVLASALVANRSQLVDALVLEPLRAAVEQRLSAALGAVVTASLLELDVGGLVLGDLALFVDGEARARPPAATVGQARVRLDWWSLLWAGVPRIHDVTLDRVDIRLGDGELGRDELDRDDEALDLEALRSGLSELLGRAADLPVARARLSHATVTLGWAEAPRALRVEGCELQLRHLGAQVVAELSADTVAYRDLSPASLRARLVLDAALIRVEALQLATPEAIAWARGEVGLDHEPMELTFAGGVQLRAEALSTGLRELSAWLPEGYAVRAERAVAAFELQGPVAWPERWLGQLRVAVSSPTIHIPGARADVALDMLYFEALHLNAHSVQLDPILADAPGMQARAQLQIPDSGAHVLSASLRLGELEVLRRTLPRTPWMEHLRPALRPSGRAEVSAQVRWTDAELEADGRLEGQGLILHDVIARDDFLASRFATDFAYRSDQPSRLALEQLELRGPRFAMRGRAVIDGPSHQLTLRVQRLDARAVSPLVPGTVGSGTLSGTVGVRGTATRPLSRVSARVRARDVTWAPDARSLWELESSVGQALPPLRVREATARVLLAGDRLRLDQVVAEGSVALPDDGSGEQGWADARVGGRAELDPRVHRLEIVVEHADDRILSQLVPGTLGPGELRGSVVIEGSAGSPVQRLSGHVELQGTHWQPPAEMHELPAVGIQRASSELRYGDGELILSGVEIDSTEGALHGGSRLAAGGHRTEATFEPAPGSALAALLPGKLEPGAVKLSAVVEGTLSEPLSRVSGQLEMTGGRWTLPEEAGLCTRSLEIASAAAHYRFAEGELRLSDVVLDTNAFVARGDTRLSPSGVRLDAQLQTQRAQGLFDAFPQLSGLVKGGRGRAHVVLETSSAGVAGVVEGHVEKGALEVESVGEGHATHHPVDIASFSYEFGPGQARIRELQIRGPELNLDLSVGWSDRGPLAGQGRLWLTPEYTDEVSKGAGPFLWLLGYSQIDTRFTLSGTDEDVRMDAEITHDLRWPLLRIGVSDRLAEIAEGERPVFAAASGVPSACAN
jgi:hypothetical protein